MKGSDQDLTWRIETSSSTTFSPSFPLLSPPLPVFPLSLPLLPLPLPLRPLCPSLLPLHPLHPLHLHHQREKTMNRNKKEKEKGKEKERKRVKEKRFHSSQSKRRRHQQAISCSDQRSTRSTRKDRKHVHTMACLTDTEDRKPSICAKNCFINVFQSSPRPSKRPLISLPFSTTRSDRSTRRSSCAAPQRATGRMEVVFPSSSSATITSGPQILEILPSSSLVALLLPPLPPLPSLRPLLLPLPPQPLLLLPLLPLLLRLRLRRLLRLRHHPGRIVPRMRLLEGNEEDTKWWI